MAEKNEYFTQKLENGTLQISEDVVASVAAAAVLEVEGVCGLSSNISTDIAEMLGMKTMARGIRRRADRRAGQRQYLRHCHAEGIKEIKKANPLLA